MDTTKNFFDAWVNTQAKLLDGLVETSKKIQESFDQVDVIEKAVSIYQEWADKQRQITENFLSNLQQEEVAMPFYENLKNWAEQQVTFSKHLFSFVQENNMMPIANEGLTQILETWKMLYQQNFEQLGRISIFNQSTNPQEIFNSFLRNTRTYMQMFEMWQSIYKVIQAGEKWVESWQTLIDVKKYQEILRNLFQFQTQENIQATFEEMQKRLQSMMSFNRSIASGIPTFDWKTITQYPFQGLEQLSNFNGQFLEHFYKVTNPYLIMMPPSREKELAYLIPQLQEKYTRYALKVAELQQRIYLTAQQSLEKSIKTLVEQYQQTNQLPTFDDFYNLWVNTTEQDLIQLFAQPQYAQLQAEMVKLGLEVKMNLDKQMEHILAPLPLVPRSEVDELNATIYELKQKVRELEKVLKADRVYQESNPEKAKKTTTKAQEKTDEAKLETTNTTTETATKPKRTTTRKATKANTNS
ncbi:MAG: hypothetical protein NZ551_00570 [Microscillaceae bacterium]|nr:hypothetical protein [Microscillaceae bacterium]MDW8459681.1 poly(R)-hydroxyalkanoic acid synthase subunit PhaE [Cytophagales bacterium]